MKKTILVFAVLVLFITTTFANANFLKTKNYKTNLTPEPPITPSGSTLLKVGYTYDFTTTSSDYDDDKIQYQFYWDSKGFQEFSSWTELFASGQSISFSNSWSFPGVYIIQVRAKYEHGAISAWSESLTVIVNYENQRRNIMLTGFWQPTSQMVVRFCTDPGVNPDGWKGENWENLGYDIYSFVAKEYYNNSGTWEMRYQQIWNEYWNIVNQLHPIAIIGFGQGGKENTWSIENKAVNWNKWYVDDDGKQPSPNPPDDTVCPGYIRLSTLPIRQIEKAINNQTSINAEINYLGTPGFYICAYMAYLQMWYKAQHSDLDDEFLCKAAGFIHVNKDISLNECIKATNITIRNTVEKVKKEIVVNEINSALCLPNSISKNQQTNNKQENQNNIFYKLKFLSLKSLVNLVKN